MDNVITNYIIYTQFAAAKCSYQQICQP